MFLAKEIVGMDITLPILLKGMLGIFASMLLVMLSIVIMNRVFKDKK